MFSFSAASIGTFLSYAPYGAIGCGLALTLYFLGAFYIPYQFAVHRLKKIDKQLSKLGDTKDVGAITPDALRSYFDVDRGLSHVWREYEETLHAQYVSVDGEEKLANLRSTAPAETFFSTSVLVDTPLKVEFFKHVPGILTGIGIIGTFSGLISALVNPAFNITSADPAVIKNSLQLLLNGVLEAFIASASAISLAMFITFIEKTALTKSYRLVERIVQRIDGLYKAGAGEEYLARLVHAAEESATQTAQLKDSFVTELKEILTNLVDRQTGMMQATTEAMGRNVGQAIQESLEKPLTQIAQVVERASGSQTENVNRVLQDTMAAMISKIEDTFGGQIKGLNSLMLESAKSMEDMRIGVAQMVTEMRQNSEKANDNMASQLTNLMTQAEERQQLMQQQIGQFLQDLKQQMEDVHTQNGEQAVQMLQGIQSQISGLMENFSRQREAAQQIEETQQKQLRAETESLVAGVGQETQALVGKVAEAIQAMQDSVGQLSNITGRTVADMNSGAQLMLNAANRFTEAGTTLTTQFARSEQLSDRMIESSASLNSSSLTLNQVVSEYGRSRDGLNALVTSLQTVAREAEEKVGVNRTLVADMQKMADKLKEVQAQTDQYLTQVSGVLDKGFKQFGDSVTENLQRSSAAFHQSLSNSVEMIANQMDRLTNALEDLPELLSKAA